MSDKEAPPDFSSHAFFSLTPDRILDAVEGALNSKVTQVRATGRASALNSIENRVYEIELDDGSSVVTKFYRPGRWTKAQILEEHAFINKLRDAEIPVCAPLNLVNGSTLESFQGEIFFTVFPKIRGRLLDELNNDQLTVLGRFLARLHAVGEGMGRSKRIHLDVKTYGWDSLHELEDSGFLDHNMGERYRLVAEDLLNRIEPSLDGVKTQLIHGDCHLGNILWNNDGPFFVDFDDMLVGPPVQDIWMIVRGDDAEADRQREVLVMAYEEMRDFDDSTLDLIEPLRVLRMIHYSAWIARRWDDPSFPRMFPNFADDSWWQSEIEALYQVLSLLNGG